MIFLTKSRAENLLGMIYPGGLFGFLKIIVCNGLCIIAMLVMLVIYLLLDFFESPPTSLHWSPLNGFQIKFLTLWALLHFQFNSLCENAQKMSFPSKSKGMTFFGMVYLWGLWGLIIEIVQLCYVSSMHYGKLFFILPSPPVLWQTLPQHHWSSLVAPR